MLPGKNIDTNFDIENQFEDFQKKNFYFLVSPGRSGKALFSGLVESNKKILIMHSSDKLLAEIDYIITLDKDKIAEYILNKNFLKRINHFDNIKKNQFRKIFKNIIKKNNLSEDKLYYLVYFCYAKVFNFDIQSIQVIFLDACYENNFIYVEKYFLNPKYIYLSRNPYDLFLSLKSLYFDQYYNSNNLNTVVYNINLYSLEIMKLNYTFFDKSRYYTIIKYEDMYKNTEFFFKKLSKYIGLKINYTNKLTYFNSPKISKSSYYSHSSNINNRIDEFRYKNNLLKREIYIITLMFHKYFKHLDYKINEIEYSKFKLIVSFLFLFKYEFFPNKKIFKVNKNYIHKSRIKNTKFYLILKYIYYFVLNLISYPKNLINVIKIIILNKYD